MLIKYTDNYGKPKTLEIPNDTSEEVLKFLRQSESDKEHQHRVDRYRLEQFEKTEEELFREAVHKPCSVSEMIEIAQRQPEKIRCILNFIKNNCTEKQKRRFYLFVLYDIPMKTIAYWESCTVESVDESILAVLKKIKFSTLPD